MENKEKSTAQIKIKKEDLYLAEKEGLLSTGQADILWESLRKRLLEKSSRICLLMYYLGAFFVISAMTTFMSLGWDWFGGIGLFLIALSYATIFFTIGYLLWKKTSLKIAGGLLTLAGVCMTPLAVFGLEKHFHLWSCNDMSKYMSYTTDNRGWLLMEASTLLVGLTALRFVRFPLLIVPILSCLLFSVIDIIACIPKEITKEPTTLQAWASVIFGFFSILYGYWMDRKGRTDFGFWGYLFGTLAFWSSLLFLIIEYKLKWFVYGGINLGMMLLSVQLKRTVLMVFGVLGILIYLGHLAYKFQNTIRFPFILSAVGALVVIAAILWQKRKRLKT